MLSYFAATDPGTGIFDFLFTQGVLGVCLIMAIIVIIYQQKKLDKKDDKIDILHNARLEDSKTHTTDYREMAEREQAVLSSNSQNMALFGEKIEVVKGRR